MTLTTLIIGIAVFALVLTSLERVMGHKLIKNFGLSLLQNFVGGLFIFSGMVKAVDPLGTAYKMEQYFGEFQTTFANTNASFLAPVFPMLSEYATAFSVIMIVFEIVLGVALLLGAMRKTTAWAYFLLVLFFTFLTGFTYLTGYVPEGVNFFQFGDWGPYEPTNMKVTDCGCFGDFLKLEPRVSFLKDVFLLIPGFLFLLFASREHQLFTVGTRRIIMVAATAAVLLYSFSNYVWNIPGIDFRPFKVGANIAERKALEEEAEQNVQVLAYRITNKTSGEVVELPFDQYLQDYAKYPTEEWDLDQVKSEPEVARTKISDFEVSDLKGNDLTDAILSEPGYSIMIVAYKLYGTETSKTIMLPDSVFAVDTVITELDTVTSTRLVRVDQLEKTVKEYQWDEDYLARWKTTFLPEMEAATAAGVKVYGLTAYSDPERIASFREALGTQIPFFQADDILLKTIVRSNPGPVLMKAGTIIMKWHYKRMPSFEEMKAEYMPTE